MSRPGLDFRDGSELTTRAYRVLEEGARSSEELARRVLGFRDVPRELAGQLVEELLSGVPEVTRAADGRWMLRGDREGSGEGVPLRDLRYAVVDVETTGSTPAQGGRVTEIAIVEVADGDVVDEFSTLVDPGRPIPPWIVRLTGIDDEMVADAPEFDEVAELVTDRLEGRVFVAHNASFDWKFLGAELRRAQSVAPVGPRLCTLRLARRALPGLRRRGLDALCEYFGVEIAARHRAGGDALATAEILGRLLEEADRRGIQEWGTLNRWLDGEEV